MASGTIIFDIVWIKEGTDCSTCYACDDVICSDMNVLHLQFKENSPKTTGIKLCNSCFDCIIK